MDVDWRRVAVYGVCRDEEQRLLLTRLALAGYPTDGHWALPGGGMEWGESPAQTLERELEEETGLAGTLGAVLGVTSTWFTAEESWQGTRGHTMGLIYEVTELSGELRTEFDEGSTDKAQWFTLDEIAELPCVAGVDFALDLL